jgi:hypothetical protein
VYRWKGHADTCAIASTADDNILWLRIGVQQFKLRTSKCIHAFPSEAEYPNSFPIVSIVQMHEDFYEPSGTIGLERLEKYWALRKQSSRSAEQAAILLAMTQAQARVLDLNRFKPKSRDDPRLQTLQVRERVDIRCCLLISETGSPSFSWSIDTMFRLSDVSAVASTLMQSILLHVR